MTATTALAVCAFLFIQRAYLDVQPVTTVRFTRTVPPVNLSAFKCSAMFAEMRALAPNDSIPAYRCKFWDWLEVVEAGRDEIFVTTFITDVLEKRQCVASMHDCSHLSSVFEAVRNVSVVVASPENIAVEVSHRILPRSDGAGGIDSETALRGTFGSREFFPGGRDVIPVADFLHAAGISHLSLRDRMTGVHLAVTIHYTNARGWFIEKPTYHYSVRAVPASTEAQRISSMTTSPYFGMQAGALEDNGMSASLGGEPTRVVRTHYGIKLSFYDKGEVAAYSPQRAFQFLVGAIVVFSWPAQLIEQLISFLPLLVTRIPEWHKRLNGKSD
jgi:hypothetical protein